MHSFEGLGLLSNRFKFWYVETLPFDLSEYIPLQLYSVRICICKPLVC